MRTKAGIMLAVVALAGPALRAQTAPAGRGAPAAPAPATARAMDLKTVLYNAQDALGMLRTAQEVDRVATIRYWGTGTMNVGGQAYKLTSYEAAVNYHVPGMRVDITRAGADGKPQRMISVVNGKYAWNEAKPGLDATPAIAMGTERLIQLWMLPQGALKAAGAAGANTKVTVEGGATVLTFPLPAPLMGTEKVTVNAKNLIEKVEARMGTTVVEMNYSDYGDWNGADYLSDVMFPKHIVQKQGGVTVLDLAVTKTNTYNPYVVMPVPDAVERAAAAQPAGPAPTRQ